MNIFLYIKLEGVFSLQGSQYFLVKCLPAAFLQIERRTTRTARPPNTPTIIATDFPTWSLL